MQGFLWLGLLFLVSLGKAWRDGVFSKVWSLVTICGLIVLMVNGLEMDQSDLGLQFVFNWSSSDLGRPDIWLDAFGQVMWSLGPTLGLVISRASYKRFRDRIRMDAYTAVTANLLVAMVLCLAVFPYQGLLSPSTHIDKSEYQCDQI
ncbi:sodium-dependent dopamine transporter-like [Homarus americanus]|uniref:sodium-dependent dopamine transporter-like n=1 Tax=Homarus americanus TaxID=6706 RepID=UPI001C46ADAC|nr:sodium-dependent dopamine transporter-like [Homarus americanus]